MFTVRSRTTRGIAAAAAIVLLVTGCIAPVPNDPDDRCTIHRAPFQRLAEEWNQRIMAWTAAGTIAGLLITFLQRNPSFEDVLRNALIGGVTGALVGYMLELQSRARTQQELTQAIEGDSVASYGRIEQLKRALLGLGRCRTRQLEALRAEVQAGRIAREVARAKLARIRRWIADDHRLVRDTTGLVDKQTRILLGAYAGVTRTPVDRLVDEWRNYRPQPTVGGGRMRYVTTALRLRAGPGTRYPIRGVIPRGAAVRVLAERDGWAEVTYRGRRGYVSSRYLSAPGSDPAGPVPAARSRREPNPVKKVAFAHRELEIEREEVQRELDRQLADVEALLRTQAWQRGEPLRLALMRR